MTDFVDRGAEAMRVKRRELIAQPLDRIWPDLMRAALEAMREPTDAMVTAADGEYRDDDRVALVGEWQTMIDAALAASVME